MKTKDLIELELKHLNARIADQVERIRSLEYTIRALQLRVDALEGRQHWVVPGTWTPTSVPDTPIPLHPFTIS